MRSALGTETQIGMATVARVYEASPNPSSWSNKATGVLAFVFDKLKSAYFFRLVSLDNWTVQWEYELYKDLQYKLLVPFFHTFNGDNHVIGFSFSDDGEANIFLNKVLSRSTYTYPYSCHRPSFLFLISLLFGV